MSDDSLFAAPPAPAKAPRSSKYGSRKFIFAAAVLISATVLVWFAKIADGVYSAVILGTIAAYMTANVAQRQVDKTAAGVDTPPP